MEQLIDEDAILKAMQSIGKEARKISLPTITVIGDDTLKALKDLKGHKFIYGIDPAKPVGDETVFGNWSIGNVNSVFTKEMLNQSKAQFEQQHMCDFRDPLWDDILKMASELERDDKQLSHFVVGSWMMNHMKDNSYIDRNVEMNTLMGYPLREDSCIPRDELWAMDRQCNILFKIKVER